MDTPPLEPRHWVLLTFFASGLYIQLKGQAKGKATENQQQDALLLRKMAADRWAAMGLVLVGVPSEDFETIRPWTSTAFITSVNT
jgi:hypothetical protein